MEEISRVRVEGWGTPRRIFRDGASLFLEVVLAGCHCSTCYARVKTVEEAASRTDLVWGWRQLLGGLFLVVDNSKAGEWAPTEFLTLATGLRISK